MKDKNMKKEKSKFAVNCNSLLKILLLIATATFILQLSFFIHSVISVKNNQNKIKQITGDILIIRDKINTAKNKIAEIESR